MKNQTQAEIKRCLLFLERSDITDQQREDAIRGLNDWFFESIYDEIEAFRRLKQHSKSIV